MAKTTSKAQPAKTGVEISDVRIQNTVNADVNEHTRAAVEALAGAVTSNANAIIAIAAILKPAPANFGAGIHLEGVNNG